MTPTPRTEAMMDGATKKPWRLESNVGAGSGGWRFVSAYATRRAAQEALDRNVGLGDEPGTYRIVDRREVSDAKSACCLGCAMPVGRAHRERCPYVRSRVVNSMQTRIEPVRAVLDAH